MGLPTYLLLHNCHYIYSCVFEIVFTFAQICFCVFAIIYTFTQICLCTFSNIFALCKLFCIVVAQLTYNLLWFNLYCQIAVQLSCNLFLIEFFLNNFAYNLLIVKYPSSALPILYFQLKVIPQSTFDLLASYFCPNCRFTIYSHPICTLLFYSPMFFLHSKLCFFMLKTFFCAQGGSN